MSIIALTTYNDMAGSPTPSSGILLGLDLDGTLKQKDQNGNITVVGSGGGTSGTSGTSGISGTSGSSGTSGVNGYDGANTFRWTYGNESTATEFKLNDINFPIDNVIYLNTTSKSGDASSWLNTLVDHVTTNPEYAYLHLVEVGTPNSYAIYKVLSGSSSGVYYNFSLSYVNGDGIAATGSEYTVGWSLFGVGEAGTSGSSGSSGSSGTLSGLDDVVLTDISDKQILQYDVTSEEWNNTSNLVLGENSTATETTYEAGAPVEIMGLSYGKNNIEKTGAQLRLQHTNIQHINIPDGYTKWDPTSLVFGAELIDSTLKYRFQVESLTLENYDQNQVLTVNAMSEAEAYAYMLSVAQNDDYFGLALSVPVTTNHINSIILSDNIVATDDKTIYADNLIVNDTISTIDRFINLGENNTATETTYEARISVEFKEPGSVEKHTTSRNGSELTLTYYGEQLQFPQFGWEDYIHWYDLLEAGTYLIDSALTYTLEVVSVSDSIGSSILVVNAASEAEAIAFESLHPTGAVGTYGLYVKTKVETSHTNTIIIGDNITANADNNLFFEKGQIGEKLFEEAYTLGDVIEDGTNVWDMFEETGGMYIEYKGLPSTFPQFIENNYIGYAYIDIFSGEKIAEYFLKITSITQESASTSGDYTGDMTFLHCEIITGTFQEIYDASWTTYDAIYTPASTHTAINIGTGNTISHNNSHIIGNDITTDAEDTLFVNNLNVSGHNLAVTDKLSQGTAVSYLPNMFSKSHIGNLGKYCNITTQCQTNDDTKQNFTIGDTAGLIVIPTNTIYNFRVLGVGADASGNTATYEIKGTAKNIAGTVTVANVTATAITDDFTITGMSAEADDTNNALIITTTGKAATTINWSAFVEWQEITFA